MQRAEAGSDLVLDAGREADPSYLFVPFRFPLPDVDLDFFAKVVAFARENPDLARWGGSFPELDQTFQAPDDTPADPGDVGGSTAHPVSDLQAPATDDGDRANRHPGRAGRSRGRWSEVGSKLLALSS